LVVIADATGANDALEGDVLQTGSGDRRPWVGSSGRAGDL